MRKSIIVFAVIFAIFASVLCGCNTNIDGIGFSVTNYSYKDSGLYAKGNAEYCTEDFKNIDISWVFGKATVIYADVEKVSLNEASDKELEDKFLMRTRIDNNTLYVKYIDSVNTLTITPRKDLTVTLPLNFKTKDFYVTVSSAEVMINGGQTEKLVFDSASGDISYSGTIDKEFKASTSSGDIDANIQGNCSLDLATSSGKIFVKADGSTNAEAHSSSGNIELDISACNRMKINTSSGNVSVKAGTSLVECKVDTSSGNVKLYFMQNFGATINYRTSSGEFSSALPATSSDNRHVISGGENQFEISTSSGDLRILSK